MNRSINRSMGTSINPEFKETIEQRAFRHNYMRKVHDVYHFHEALGLMDLGEDKKISLQDIYVPLRFSRKELDEGRGWETEDYTNALLDILGRPNNQLDILDRTNNQIYSNFIVLSGRPGSGKTTISRMIMNLLSSDALTGLTEKCGRRIPIYFKLRDYHISNLPSAESLLEALLESQSKTIGFEISREHLEFYLKQGWCFLIFDGVDEVGGLENRLKIRKFIMGYFALFSSENYLLVTSRPSGLESAPFNSYINKNKEKDKSMRLLDLFYVDSFNKSQAQEFSRKWFSLREENPEMVKIKADEFIDSIEKIKSLSSLKRRPVFLTMMAHIHTTKGKLPYSRASAYEYMVQAYIEHLDITRRLHKTMYKEEEFLDWSFDDKIRLLQGIAYKFHTSKNRDENHPLIVVDRNELLLIIRTIIKDNQEIWQTIKQAHAERLLKFYLTRTGLLHEPEEDKIQFSHLSFEEYLTARFIYKKVIERNLFKAVEAIKEEILDRLTKKTWDRWSETILLFFSLNKEAVSDILEAMEEAIKNKPEKTKGDKQDKDYYFHILTLKMLDSEEYGIKDSDMNRWVRKVIRFICMLDSNKKKSKNAPKESQAFSLIQDYFLSTDRKSKIENSKTVLIELFDQYFKAIQKNNQDVLTRNSLKNILYFISYREELAMELKSKVKNALPVLLDRKRFDINFLSCYELLAFRFPELAESVLQVYTLDEAILNRDLLSFSISKTFSLKIDTEKFWSKQLLKWEWVIENLYTFSFFNLLHLSKDDLNITRNGEMSSPPSEDNFGNKIFAELYKNTDDFWCKCWYRNIWHEHPGGLHETRKSIPHRDFAKCYYINATRRHSLHIENPLISAEYNIDFHRFDGILQEKKLHNSIFFNKLTMLITAFFFAISDIDFRQKYTNIDNPWQTYNDFKDFYQLLCEPESLYDYLCQTVTNNIDRETFLTQYKEYDLKPYSMRNMAKVILDSGAENYPHYSSDEAAKISAQLMREALDMLECYTSNAEERKKRGRKKKVKD